MHPRAALMQIQGGYGRLGPAGPSTLVTHGGQTLCCPRYAPSRRFAATGGSAGFCKAKTSASTLVTQGGQTVGLLAPKKNLADARFLLGAV